MINFVLAITAQLILSGREVLAELFVKIGSFTSIIEIRPDILIRRKIPPYTSVEQRDLLVGSGAVGCMSSFRVNLLQETGDITIHGKSPFAGWYQ